MTRAGLLLGGLLLGLTGCTAEMRTCSKMKSLCNVEAETCKSTRADLEKSMGADALKAFDTCFTEANSCTEAMGCHAGASLKGLGDAAQGFIDGLQKGLEKKKE